MIEGKTKSGFEFQLDENVMNNMELVDLLADDTENEVIKTSRALKMIMDPDQKKRLYDHLRTPSGRVPADAVMEAIQEIFTACGQQEKLLTLILMLATDRDAMVCDLAETYGIFDYRTLPVPTLATMASGLRETSRIKMRLSGYKVTRSDMLLAAAVDRLSFIHWALTGSDGGNPPKSILDTILDLEEAAGDIEAFATAESFEDAWEAATGVRHG